MTASTANYLWSMEDVLGQGATASVFKARNKVCLKRGKRGMTAAMRGETRKLIPLFFPENR